MRILVTGTAGFIGAALAQRLLARGDVVHGFDNHNDYYDPALKEARLAHFIDHPNYIHQRGDLADATAVDRAFASFKPQRVANLAAQAGVRYSIKHPRAYVQSNLVGFVNILEGCRQNEVEHLVYASSSSVYGANRKLPFAVEDAVDHPVSLYAASKKANELMAHTYSHLYDLPTTGLRFFTVYGPRGRPDMSPILFADRISRGEPIDVFNHGHHSRDFTYIDDIVEGVIRTLDHPAEPDHAYDAEHPNPATSSAPYRVYNIGNDQPVQLLRFIELLEQNLGRTVEKRLLPMQPIPGPTYRRCAAT
jgi:UDP-glucuronate 4-epimerase